jgi:sugar lactone lactonase YvrE
MNKICFSFTTATRLRVPGPRQHYCPLGIALALLLGAVPGFAQLVYQPYTFVTVAGKAQTAGTNDGPGAIARFRSPNGLALDSSGNLFVADQGNFTIRRIDTNGVVTTLAGQAGISGTNNGTGDDARFQQPDAVAVDNAGNVYVADVSTIRKVTPDGTVTTLAGQANKSGSTDGTVTNALFGGINGLAVDGTVYVADTYYNHTIRKITSDGVVTTLAGLAGVSGTNNGSGSNARFYYPFGVTVDGNGNVYVADMGNYAIRKVTPDGTVTTVAGLAGNSGKLDGIGTDARFSSVNGVALDAAGNCYVSDLGNDLIRKITPAGVVTTLAGRFGGASVDGTGSAVGFGFVAGVVVDSAGNVFVADAIGKTIRKGSPESAPAAIIQSAYTFSTFAGRAGVNGTKDGTGNGARFSGPQGLVVDRNGNAYIADSQNHTIRKMTPDRVVTTVGGFAGNSGSSDGTGSEARFNQPLGVAADSAGNIYVADTFNHALRKINPDGVVATLAGLPGVGGTNDGPGNAARFDQPSGVTVDASSMIYVADTLNCMIRKVTPEGVVTTLAGMAQFGPQGSFQGSHTDGTGSTARFAFPTGIAVDSSGIVYVADTDDSTIRKVTPSGVVTTLAGTAFVVGNLDGPGSSARFNQPKGIAIDTAGNLYIADTGNNLIRKISPTGVVTTLGGLFQGFGTSNGTGADAQFGNPSGIAADIIGNVYVADTGNNTIRKGMPAPIVYPLQARPSFNLVGPAGQLVVVESSSDLLNWRPLWTNTFNGTLTFSDTPPTGSTNCYYRAITP